VSGIILVRMPYISLYRKYRPQTFEDVVGQEHITTTLKNAVATGRVANGYLFCGTRGTAKTTCARVLAKALNCIGPDGLLKQPTPTPCGRCGPCLSISGSSFVDVLEMDAASHGKVDDVRDLVASIKFPPMEGRYKVYIIDEAHQLSRDAMDAFLKTLEEPPDRVIFILATTELEKLPITIASRCQVFEFKRGSIAQISGRLTEVLKNEGVTASSEAIQLVARAADGSYRDSLSLVEQVLAYRREDVTAEDVTLVLGMVGEDLLNRVVESISTTNSAAAFEISAEVLSSGKDIRQFLKSLSSRFRDMLYVAVGAKADSDFTGPAQAWVDQVKLFSPPVLLKMLETISDSERDARWNNQHRLLLEMTLLRLIELSQSRDQYNPDTARSIPAPTQRQASNTAAAPSVPARVPDDKRSTAAVAAIQEPPRPAYTAATNIAPPLVDEVDDDNSVPSLIITSEDEAEVSDDLITEEFLTVQQVDAAIPQPVTRASGIVPTPGASPELIQLQRSWQEVINRMGTRSTSGVPLVRDATPIAMEGSIITLQFASPFHFDRIQQNERGRKTLEDIISKTLDVPIGTYKIKCILGKEPVSVSMPGPASKPKSIMEEEEPHSPLMDEVIAVFGGKLLDDEDTTKGY
jgi:DNA polymerase-3 subunit gamma/tau